MCFYHCLKINLYLLFSVLLKHPFVKSAKGVSILQDLINEAMDVKLKRQEAQQREVDQDDDENSVSGRRCGGFRSNCLLGHDAQRFVPSLIQCCWTLDGSVLLETLTFDYFAPIFFFPVYLFLEGGRGVISQLGGLVFPSSFKIFMLYSGITHNLVDSRGTCVCAGNRIEGREEGPLV